MYGCCQLPISVRIYHEYRCTHIGQQVYSFEFLCTDVPKYVLGVVDTLLRAMDRKNFLLRLMDRKIFQTVFEKHHGNYSETCQH